MTDKKRIILFYAVLVGLILRIYLILKLPAWYDEFTTLKIISHSFLEVIAGKLDPVHPSGYYTFLKLWSLVSKNLIWLRTSTLMFYLINLNLFNRIGTRIRNRSFGFIVTIFYVFSGYFLIFDWQFRMYTGLSTIILASYLLFNKNLNKKTLLLFFAVNLVGLFFDYGFMFYFFPLLLWTFIQIIRKKENRLDWFKKMATLGISLTMYMSIFGNLFWNNFGNALKLIDWLPNFTSPKFFIPFFLGTFSNTFITILLLPIVLFGLKSITDSLKGLVFISASALAGCLFLNLFGIVLLHVRSMQIVGITFLVLLANGWCQIYRSKKLLALTILVLVVINTLYIVTKIPSWPGEYLITYVSE